MSISRKTGLLGASNDPKLRGALVFGYKRCRAVKGRHLSKASTFEQPLPQSTTIASRISWNKTAQKTPPFRSMTPRLLYIIDAGNEQALKRRRMTKTRAKQSNAISNHRWLTCLRTHACTRIDDLNDRPAGCREPTETHGGGRKPASVGVHAVGTDLPLVQH